MTSDVTKNGLTSAKPKRSSAANVPQNAWDCQYTFLADTEQLKAWRCKAPALPAMPSTSRSPRFGIAIVGGTNGLTFDVGYYI